MKTFHRKAVLLAAVLAAAAASSSVYGQTTVVTPTQPGLWSSANDAGSGNSVISTNEPRGAGTGSLSFEGMDSSDDRAEARRVLGKSLGSITAIGYDYWTDTTSETRQPALKIEYYGVRSGTLSWFPANNAGPINQWVNVDATAGLWFSSETQETKTLAEFQAELGSALANYIRVGTSAGSNDPLNEGYADLVTITTTGVGGGTNTWDFEATSAAPLPPPQLITVTPEDPEFWTNPNDAGTGVSGITNANPRGPDGAAGTGSIEFAGMDSSDDRAEFRRVFGRSLLSVVGIGYDYWTDSTDVNRQPSLKLEFFGNRSGTLSYIPANNGGTTNQWNSVDAITGQWRSSENGVTQTLAEHQADLGNVLVNFIRVGTSAGSSVGLTTAYADLVSVTTPDLGTRVWDFEDVPPPPLPSQVVVTVDATDAAGWFAINQAGSATAALTVTNPRGPGNTGSLEYTTSGDTADIISVARIPLVSVADVRAIGYDYYTENTTLAPALKMEYFSLLRSGTLVYEPINQGSFPVNGWNSVDGTVGLWWSTEFGQVDKRTLAQWQVELGEILVNFLQVGVGSGWPSATTSFADSVYLATTESNTLWDFEGMEQLPPPPLEVVTVDADNPAGWFTMDQAGAATGEITTTQPFGPGGTGSLEFTTSGNTVDIIHVARIPLVRLTEVQLLGYDFFSSDGSVAPALKLPYFGLAHTGTLVYDPANQSAYTVGAWNNVADATATGMWWTTEFGQTDLRTFAAWQSALGDVPVTLLQVGVGSGWSTAMTGHADQVVLQTSSSNTLWDFEQAAVLPPAPVITTTTITSSTPNPSFTGEPVAIVFTVTTVGSAAPTGTVVVSDGANSCMAPVATGTCTITFVDAGTRSLVAEYTSDDISYGNSTSVAFSHVVNMIPGPIPTTTTITASAPNPSKVGVSVTISYQVTNNTTGVPTGTVSVSDGTNSCSGTVAAGSCSIVFASAGTKSLVASYTGSSAPSMSPAYSHLVEPGPIRSYTGTLPSGATGVLSFTTADADCTFATSPQFLGTVTLAPPASLSLVDGVISFTVSACAPGATVMMSMVYGSALPTDSGYWKAGTPWFQLPASISGSAATFSITDGGTGDTDGSANGIIIDPGGVATSVPSSSPATPVPTSPQWALIILGLLMAGVGVSGYRRRYQAQVQGSRPPADW